MKQSVLDRSVAKITGETRRTIRRRGFSLMPAEELTGDELCLALDCPGCGTTVSIKDCHTDQLSELAECTGCDVAFPYTENELHLESVLSVTM